MSSILTYTENNNEKVLVDEEDGKIFVTNSLPGAQTSKAYTVSSSNDAYMNNSYIYFVTPDSGYDSMEQVIVSVPEGSVSSPAEISATNASISTGGGILTLSKNISTAPQVSAGYIKNGTTTNSNVSLTASANIQGQQTITPGQSNFTIANNTYLTGTQTILGDANLTAANIKNEVSIFGVTGNCKPAITNPSVKYYCNYSGTANYGTSYKNSGANLTITTTGKYTVFWCAYRSTTGVSSGSRLCKGDNYTVVGGDQTTFDSQNPQYQYVYLNDLSFEAGDKLSIWVKGGSSSSYYTMQVLCFIAVQTSE